MRNLLEKLSLLAVSLSMVLAPLVLAEGPNQLAFPSAEGFGKYAKGGRGGDVYHVTNLRDDGPGSLRYGIDTADNPRTIIFDVAGTIRLATPIRMEMDTRISRSTSTASSRE